MAPEDVRRCSAGGLRTRFGRGIFPAAGLLTPGACSLSPNIVLREHLANSLLLSPLIGI